MEDDKTQARLNWEMMMECSYDRLPRWWYDREQKEGHFEEWYQANKRDGE